MPTYTFLHVLSNTVFTTVMSMAEREEYLAANNEIQQLIVAAPVQVDAHKLSAVKMKPTIDFQNRLKDIKAHHRHSTINTWGTAEV
jgi:hypothetical protein